ncbi:sensor histidine kinase [Nocardiopsis composta]|uniref:histidine kinase n=1 Tax=Nocardiopsis composta TaxID=157465 RepID=A0A7W8QR70_9ACTN|nr:sensor histidine kinase [Nocardiopsis composta]MBB5435118.1 signal transduction histidine kinase [Nocardiopsis composta]
MIRLPPRPSRTDVLIAAALAAVVVLPTVALDLWHTPPFERPLSDLGFLGYILMLLGTAPLVWLRTAPVPTGLVVVPAATVYYPLGFPDGPLMLCAAVALFVPVAQGMRWQGWTLGIAQWLTVYAWEFTNDGGVRIDQAFGVLAWVLVVLISAELVRWRRDYLSVQEQRRADAARSREEEILRRAADERLRLAREVHDTVAHSISLINVQAGTALYLIESEPERAAEALATIKRTSKSTLQELRATLDVLRAVDEKAPRSPAPALDGLEALAEETRTAGLEVSLQVTGERRLPPNVEAAGYRIVQEALTNAVRHSGAAHARVGVVSGERWLEISVADDGNGAPGGVRPGNGITGMRERATMLGGDFSAGPGPDGRGFEVRARLPHFPADGGSPRPGGAGRDGAG